MAAAPTRVLVIEDDPEIREGLRQLFVREGYQVVVAETGMDAIVKARHTRVDVVVTDLELPDISGIVVVRTLRNLQKRTCRIVVYTGFGESHAEEALTAGADVVLTKAASFALLLVACGTRPELTRDHGAVAIPPRPGPPAS
jgi:DNA-binding response OmpR family regulator